MTQEEKELLLKDLCARLPYGVQVLSDSYKEFDGGLIAHLCKIEPYTGDEYPDLKNQFLFYQYGCFTPYTIEEIRPYLRPMSSMTEEEKKEYKKYFNSIEGQLIGIKGRCIWLIDWLNKNMFDYCGLIERGLALEAPKDMYK